MPFVVDPKTLSFSKAIEETKAFIDLKPDASKWTDFFASSAGQTIIELLAGLKIYDAHQTIVGRRETYLSYANNLSSNIAIAQNLGYSVDKGSNAHIRLSIIPNTTIVLPKYSIVGSLKDKDLMILNQESFTTGVPMTIDVVVGTLSTQQITIPSSDLQLFRFTNPNVTEDFRLLLNGTEVAKSEIILDFNNDKYIALTNSLTSIDVIYKNNATNPVPTNPYVASDILTLEYIVLGDLTFDELTDPIFNYGAVTLASSVRLSEFRDVEGKTSIKINAPLYHETQRVIKSRDDFRKTFKQLDSSLSDTNGHDLSPSLIELTYVKNDLSLLNATEKLSFSSQLESFVAFGIPLPLPIIDPTQIDIAMDVTVTLSDVTTTLSTVTTDVSSIVSDFEKKLAVSLDLSDIEEKINELSYVKTSRLNITSMSFATWQPATSYLVGANVNSSNPADPFYYKCIIPGTSGGIEPTFPVVNGGTVDEGPSLPQLRWQAVSKNNNSQILDWDEYFIFANSIALI